MMKRTIIFITLSIFLLISLGLPRKILADVSCPEGISGQFLDAQTKEPLSDVGFIINETYWNTAYKEEMNDSTWSASSDSQGKFNYSRSLKGYNIILTIGGKSGYITKTIKLSNCFDNIINLEPKVSDDKDMCNKPCDGPNDDICEGATDSCTYCGVYEETGFKTFYRCMMPPIRETGITISPNATICGNNPACKACLEENNSWTALGCLHTGDPQSFVGQILRIVLPIAGGIAFLLMIFGGLQIIFSGGNPDKVKAGKEMITAALAGLLLIIFSVFILRVIGYDILRLKGFYK
jgi:hypothetical protein